VDELSTAHQRLRAPVRIADQLVGRGGDRRGRLAVLARRVSRTHVGADTLALPEKQVQDQHRRGRLSVVRSERRHYRSGDDRIHTRSKSARTEERHNRQRASQPFCCAAGRSESATSPPSREPPKRRDAASSTSRFQRRCSSCCCLLWGSSRLARNPTASISSCSATRRPDTPRPTLSRTATAQPGPATIGSCICTSATAVGSLAVLIAGELAAWRLSLAMRCQEPGAHRARRLLLRDAAARATGVWDLMRDLPHGLTPGCRSRPWCRSRPSSRASRSGSARASAWVREPRAAAQARRRAGRRSASDALIRRERPAPRRA
jgi:hypothetical protein